MKILIRALCVVSVLGGAVHAGTGKGEGQQQREDEALLAALAGVHGLNRAGVCVGGARCEAALVGAQWAATRASCLRGAAPPRLRLVRDADGLSCADLDAGVTGWETRHVRSRVRPSLRHDLDLLTLDRPYAGIDHHDNSSYVNRFLKEWEPWMSVEPPRPVSYGHEHALLSTPTRMLLTTVLLPMLSFIALFMFVVFCTGLRDPLPYQAIEDAGTEKTDSLGV